MYLDATYASTMSIPAVSWHAHEMIYGYGLAVIAGFLLTAVRNWTGIQTLHGIPLLALLLLWIAGRLLFFIGEHVPPMVVAIIDCAFTFGLICALMVPIARAGQWKQLGIIAKLLLLLAGNAVFHAGLSGLIEDGVRIGLYSGVYIIIALIFVMARRVYPFFIERGVGYSVTLTNHRWLDITSLLLFLVFWVLELADPQGPAIALVSALLALLHTLRLVGWHTIGIWSKPLLWVLFAGYGWLVVGFILKTAVYVFGISPFIALHAFVYGGIGMITLGMMSRVTLGHTGRDLAKPPAALHLTFALLLAGSICRVLLPLLVPAHHVTWISLSQGFWVIAFILFLLVHLPMLLRARVDGKPG